MLNNQNLSENLIQEEEREKERRVKIKKYKKYSKK